MAESRGPYLIQAKDLHQDWWKANDYCKHTPFYGWLKYLVRNPAFMEIWVDNKEKPKCVFLVNKAQEDGKPDYVIIEEIGDVEDKIQLVTPFLQKSDIIRSNKDIDFDYVESDLWELTVTPALRACHPSLLARCHVRDLGACLSPERHCLVIPGEDYHMKTDVDLIKTDLRTDLERRMLLRVVGDETPGWPYSVGHTVFGRVLPVSHRDWQTQPMRAALAILGSTLLDEGREIFVVTDENNLEPFLELRLKESRRLKRIEYRRAAGNGT